LVLKDRDFGPVGRLSNVHTIVISPEKCGIGGVEGLGLDDPVRRR
jgi:hypothetical protein